MENIYEWNPGRCFTKACALEVITDLKSELKLIYLIAVSAQTVNPEKKTFGFTEHR